MPPLVLLTPRWNSLRYHEVQFKLYNDNDHRFIINPAGRRSGKTEIAKRKLIRRAITCQVPGGGRFIFAAPTRDQAKRIYWKDLKNMVPKWMQAKVNETELTVTLLTGTTISVIGMDKPERVEGDPLDGIVLDEYANMKAHAWDAHVRPALSTPGRFGWAMLIGVPEGRNHYWKLYTSANERKDWGAYHCLSKDILPASEIESAREEMDELTFRQEYEADFVMFSGAVYYPFNRKIHCVPTEYDPKRPLCFCFDFNVEPGVSVVLQETARGTEVLGEVHIPRNSNTIAVCNKLKADWGHHTGPIHIYGDASGGARGTAQVEGSDWDLIRKELPGAQFFLKRKNPPERSRINAVNSRLLSASGVSRIFISNAPNLVECFEGTRLLEGGSGEIDKKATPHLTHQTDAFGYYVEYRHPVVTGAPTPVQYG